MKVSGVAGNEKSMPYSCDRRSPRPILETDRTIQKMGPGNRPLDLDWLEDFIALAESGNFSRAAQARNIAQPAFSRHIKSLEEWVGVDLFDRTSHPVSLTAAGVKLRPEIEDTLHRLEAARHVARVAHEQAAISLQFAATHALSLTLFPAWLSAIEARLPAARKMGPIQMVSDLPPPDARDTAEIARDVAASRLRRLRNCRTPSGSAPFCARPVTCPQRR